jgi:hypothetical protein
MSSSPVQFAIIGRGLPAGHRINALQRSTTAALVAAIDSTGLDTTRRLGRFPVHASAGAVRLPHPKASVWVSLDEQTIAQAIAPCEAVVLSDPKLCTDAAIRGFLSEGRHVLADYVPTSNATELQALFTLAESSGLLFHVSCVSLFQGVPLTLSARIKPISVEFASLVIKNNGEEPDDVGDLLWRNSGALLHLLDLTGAITQIDDISYTQRVLQVKMQSVHGAAVSLELSQFPNPEVTFDLTVKDHLTTWRQINESLYQGRSPQTILQGLSVYRDELARFTRAIRLGVPLHPSSQLWEQTLDLADALSHLSPGSLHLSAP